MSTGLGFTTVLGCLQAGEEIVRLKPEDWVRSGKACSEMVRFLREENIPWRKSLKYFDEDSLRSYATQVLPDIKKKMQEWKMHLNDLPDGGFGAIYMISQLRENLKWLKMGKMADARLEWPEFILEDHVNFYRYEEHALNPVISIEVENGDRVYMIRQFDRVASIDLPWAIRNIEERMRPYYGYDYVGVQIPCVSADIEADLSWLVGIKNKEYFIAYAQQKILFGMNQTGFAVREETGMMMRETCVREPKSPYILSPNGEGFLFWRRRPGVPYPVSMFWFYNEDFKDPGDLSKIVE